MALAVLVSTVSLFVWCHRPSDSGLGLRGTGEKGNNYLPQEKKKKKKNDLYPSSATQGEQRNVISAI